MFKPYSQLIYVYTSRWVDLFPNQLKRNTEIHGSLCKPAFQKMVVNLLDEDYPRPLLQEMLGILNQPVKHDGSFWMEISDIPLLIKNRETPKPTKL